MKLYVKITSQWWLLSRTCGGSLFFYIYCCHIKKRPFF